MCNRVVWLDHGRIQMSGPADEVIALYQGYMEGGAQQRAA
jgi:ABC-type polysaccharide/polyol phosphate transport system ATPase subunit